MIHLTGIGTRIQGTTYTMPCNKPGAGGTVPMVMLPMQLACTPVAGVRLVTTHRSTTTMEELVVNLGTVSRKLNFSSFLATDTINYAIIYFNTSRVIKKKMKKKILSQQCILIQQ